MNNDQLSIVIRSMPGREHFLDKCLFTLSAQHYRNLQVIVVAQVKENQGDAGELVKIVESWRHRFVDAHFISHSSDKDARARSLNLGIKCSTGRYLAFLDDDDKVYPAHYEKLISELLKSDYSWAYADIVRAEYDESGRLMSRSMPFKRDRYSYFRHLQGNFIPIHSFVIDRERAHDMPMIDERFDRLEDYNFLLHLAKAHEPLYVSHIGAEYCIRNDGTNSVQDGTAQLRAALEKKRLWTHSQNMLEEQKFHLVGWWVREINEHLPSLSAAAPAAPPIAGPVAVAHTHSPRDLVEDFYFRNALRNLHNSHSWRLTKFARNAMLRARGLPKEVLTVPETELEAQSQIWEILTSSSWELTAPLRVLPRIWRNRRRR